MNWLLLSGISVVALRFSPLTPQWIFQRCNGGQVGHLLKCSEDWPTIARLVEHSKYPLYSHYLHGCTATIPYQTIPVSLWPSLFSADCIARANIPLNIHLVEEHPRSMLTLMREVPRGNLSLIRRMLEVGLERDEVDLEGPWWYLDIPYPIDMALTMMGNRMASLIWPRGIGGMVAGVIEPVDGRRMQLVNWLMSDFIYDFGAYNSDYYQRQVCQRIYLLWQMAKTLKGTTYQKHLRQFLKRAHVNMSKEHYRENSPFARLKLLLQTGNDEMLEAVWDGNRPFYGQNNHWAILWYLHNRGSKLPSNIVRIWKSDWNEMLSLDRLPVEWETKNAEWTVEWATMEGTLTANQQRILRNLPISLRLHKMRRQWGAMEALPISTNTTDEVPNAVLRFATFYDVLMPPAHIGLELVCQTFVNNLVRINWLKPDGEICLAPSATLRRLIGCITATILLGLPPWPHPIKRNQLEVLLGWDEKTGWRFDGRYSLRDTFPHRRDITPDELIALSIIDIDLETIHVYRIQQARGLWRTMLPMYHLFSFPEIYSLILKNPE